MAGSANLVLKSLGSRNILRQQECITGKYFQVAIAYGTGEVVGEFSREDHDFCILYNRKCFWKRHESERICAKCCQCLEAVCLTNHEGQNEAEGLKTSDCLQAWNPLRDC